MLGLVPKALWVILFNPGLALKRESCLLSEAEHAVGMPKQLSWPGFCGASAYPTHSDRCRTWAAALASHNTNRAQLSPVLEHTGLLAGFPLSIPCPRHLCQVSSLSLGLPCAFPGLGSCCSFCPESLFSFFCLIKSLFFKPCFNVILTSCPPLSELIAPSFVLLNST